MGDGVDGYRIGNRDPYGRMGGKAKRSHRKQHGNSGCRFLVLVALATAGGLTAVGVHLLSTIWS